MTTTENRPRKRAPRKPAHNAATVLARFRAKATTPMYNESYTLTPGSSGSSCAPWNCWTPTTRRCAAGSGSWPTPGRAAACIEIASRDARAGQWVTHVFGPPAATLAAAIRGEETR